MKYGKGTVKKYSREYTRTLKDGHKKKYKTEQIQITIPKQEDIYTNGEEVLIIPSSQKDQLEDNSEIITSLEIFNYLLNDELNQQKDIITKKDDEIANLSEKQDLNENKEYNELKKEFNDLVDKYYKLEKEFYSVKYNEKYNDYLAKRFKEFILKVD